MRTFKEFRCETTPGDFVVVQRDGNSVALALSLYPRREPYNDVVFLKPADARALAVELVREADKIDGGAA